MSEHATSVEPAQKMDARGKLFRWACSCGARGKGLHGYEGQADSAGREHARSKGRP